MSPSGGRLDLGVAPLADLEQRVRDGLARLPARFHVRQADWLMRQQRTDGGFAGRAGESDLYYTAFALRCAEALRLDVPAFWHAAERFLHGAAADVRDLVDLYSLLDARRIVSRALGCAFSDRQRDDARFLADCRTPGGGFARRPDGEPEVYATFLAALSHSLLALPIPDAPRAAEFLRQCRCDDGGFADRPSRIRERGGTNPTAAAIVCLHSVGALDEDVLDGASGLLATMQRDDGGFAAHAEAPEPDLLSTFTALSALERIGALRRVALAAAGRFVQRLVLPQGGFRSTPSDTATDAEYTFYGIGALGLLAAEAGRKRAECPCARDATGVGNGPAR